MDDITVLIVDINPASFISVAGKSGGDGTLKGKGGEEDKKCTIC
jgi:hypothetical protein